ncbi:MAG: hypothetical protein HN509_05600 [Halobacteriovoraceae bacterium]|mgnify:CR=1 FL=1|jgi:16S rRNA (guanine527-N7)-methyltransferase|nr:hypothetical protein [Halobacteriovoraceae bacterium]MBT5096114.1 hypothetical protein [Halobacteriovoraceae bacterium]
MREFSKKYQQILNGPLAGINLTRISEPEEFYHKQILDSVLPLENSEHFKKRLLETKLLLDVGFGGGFPLVPLAKNLPEVTCLGFEARGKKATAVSEISKELGLENVRPCHIRLEEVLLDKDVVITVKAVADIRKILEMIKGRDAKVSIFFYKGPNLQEKEEWASCLAPIGAWTLLEDISYPVEMTDGRRLISFERNFVPRGTAKELVNLSELL